VITTDVSPAPAEPAARRGLVPRSAEVHAYRRRRWPRRLLIGLNIFVGVCLLAVSCLYAYVSYRFGQIQRVTIAGLSIGAAPSGSHSVTYASSAGPPMNILVVGSDTRVGLSDGAAFGGGSVGGARSDTIMLIHLDPGDGTASLLSIPRDLWVPIQGMGTQRINAAFNNGPDLLVRTIQNDLGIPINHYVDIDFDSFRQVVDALHGIKFWYPEPLRDNDNGVNDSGLNITAPGCYTLTGDMALSLVRTRHLQYEDNGEWIFEPESDLARIRRQQLFVRKVIAKAESLGFGNVTAMNGIVGGVVSNLTIDSGFSQAEMLKLARRYRNFNPASLPTATLPTTATVIDGNDVLLLEQGPAQQVIDLWEGVQLPAAAPAAPASPAAVTVVVSNGSGVAHQAAGATQALRNAGFNAVVGGAAGNYGYPESVVEYTRSDLAAAQAIQARIAGGAELQVDPTGAPGTVALITGASYQGIQAVAAQPTEETPTTAAPSAASTAAALAAIPGNSSNAPAFPGPHGQDPPPPGSGC